MSKKILSSNDNLSVIREDNPNKTIGLCHGCFDVVHPGHIRHLEYASERCDILVVSITADAYILKSGKPIIPAQMRAKNLLAIEYVDYVVITYHETVEPTFRLLIPDFFFKGKEYSGITRGTILEDELCKEFNTTFLFTPADIVYSSTYLSQKYQEFTPLSRAREAFGNIYDTYKLKKDSLLQILETSGRNILLIGDLILDRRVHCEYIGSSRNTPTIAGREQTTQTTIGGTSIVAAHAASMGSTVYLVGVTGEDRYSKYFKTQLPDSIELEILIDRSRPTVLKTTYWIDRQKVLRVDRMNNTPISRSVREKLLERISNTLKSKKIDLVTLCNFGHGLFTKETIIKIIGLCRGIPVVADSQITGNIYTNIRDMVGATIAKVNESEARYAMQDHESSITELGEELCRHMNSTILLTLGDKGLFIFDRSRIDELPVFNYISPISLGEKDGTGAGDAFLGTFLSLFSNNLLGASILAALAGGIEAERIGNQRLTKQDLIERIDLLTAGSSK